MGLTINPISSLSQGVHYFSVLIPSDPFFAAYSLFFRSAKGLSRSFEKEMVAEGGRNFGAHALWKGPASHGEVTLENGLVSSTSLWSWSRLVDSGTDFRRDVTILHLMAGPIPIPVQIYTLVSAWPVSWSASDLDASSSTLAGVTLKLAYDDLLVGPLATSAAEPAKAVLATTEGSTLTFTFPLNPNQLTISRSVSWTGTSAAAVAYPPLTAPKGALDTLTINGVVLDGGDTKTSIAPLMATLYKMTVATEISGVKQPRPPLVAFTWSNTRFVGGLSSVSFDVGLFSAAGDPLRAKANLTLNGQYVLSDAVDQIEVSANSRNAAKGGGGGSSDAGGC